VEYWGKYPQKTIVDNLPFARPEPSYPPEIVEAVSKAIQGVLQGGIPPEEASKKAHEEIQTYLDKKKGKS
jgi:multiple sugar transport system substrate-binding protein